MRCKGRKRLIGSFNIIYFLSVFFNCQHLIPYFSLLFNRFLLPIMRILLLLMLLSIKINAADINFIPNDISLARVKAQQENKLILVKFHAEWCVTCKVMNESTWIDPNVINYVEENCVATQVDYDNIDGITYRNFFKVDRLPTLLILDACGTEVARLENGATSDILLQWIALFNNKENRVCDDGNSAALPSAFIKYEAPVNNEDQTTNVDDTTQPQVITQATIVYGKKNESAVSPQQTVDKEKWRLFKRNKKNKKTEEPTKVEVSPAEIASETNSFASLNNPADNDANNDVPREEVAELSSTVAEPVEKPAKTTITVPVLKKSSISKHSTESVNSTNNKMVFEMPAKGYSVQVLATITPEKAEEMKQYCLENFKKPVAIIAPTSDQYYRVVVGMYDKRTEADKSKIQVRNVIKGAFVRDLSK
jgi:thiol-disulfide isomerase/thioredoxin